MPGAYIKSSLWRNFETNPIKRQGIHCGNASEIDDGPFEINSA